VKSDATFKSVWDTINEYQQSAYSETAKENALNETIETIESVAADSMIGISSVELTSALKRVGVAKENVTQAAPVSSIQGKKKYSPFILPSTHTLKDMLVQSYRERIAKVRLANHFSPHS
jgi:hypothetical protein